MRISRNQFIKAMDSQYTRLCLPLSNRSAWQYARWLSGIIQLTERGKAHAGVYYKGLALTNFRSESRNYKNAIYWKGLLQYVCHTPAMDNAVINWWTSFLMQSLIIKISIWLLHGSRLGYCLVLWWCGHLQIELEKFVEFSSYCWYWHYRAFPVVNQQFMAYYYWPNEKIQLGSHIQIPMIFQDVLHKIYCSFIWPEKTVGWNVMKSFLFCTHISYHVWKRIEVKIWFLLSHNV